MEDVKVHQLAVLPADLVGVGSGWIEVAVPIGPEGAEGRRTGA